MFLDKLGESYHSLDLYFVSKSIIAVLCNYLNLEKIVLDLLIRGGLIQTIMTNLPYTEMGLFLCVF